MKKLILFASLLVAGALLGYQVWSSPKIVEATVDSCSQKFTYEKSSDYSDFRVYINFSNGDQEISVSAQSGYKINKVWLDVKNDGYSGYHLYANGPLSNFNPNPGNQIDWAKTEVEKVCASASPSPSASPTASPTASPAQCKHKNAECEINNSEKTCCAGLTCVPFNDQSGNYKCELAGSSSPSPSASPTASPTASPSDDPKPTETPINESPSPEPTDNGDICDNIDGIQTGVPEGKHLDASGLNCVEYQLGGAPTPAEVSSTGQVLGASSLAGTGVAEEGIFNLIFALGSLLSAFGIRKFSTSRVK